MQIPTSKYKSWRQSIEGDYFSLYIKTWFALLSSLHELYPERINNRGDGELIDFYAQKIKIPSNYEELERHIKKVYELSEKLIRNSHFKKYYFQTFHEVNNTYNFKERNISGHISILVKKTKEKRELQSSLKKKEFDQLYCEIRSTQKQFLKHLKPTVGESNTYTINAKIDLKDLIKLNIYNNDFQIVNFLKSKIVESIEEIIEKRGHTEKQKTEAYDFLIQTTNEAFQVWNRQFASNDLFPKLPEKSFPYSAQNKIPVIKWFIDYSYKLRNVLFHIIVDPYDTKWLPIYKHSYLALKLLVDININNLILKNINIKHLDKPDILLTKYNLGGDSYCNIKIWENPTIILATHSGTTPSPQNRLEYILGDLRVKFQYNLEHVVWIDYYNEDVYGNGNKDVFSVYDGNDFLPIEEEDVFNCINGNKELPKLGLKAEQYYG